MKTLILMRHAKANQGEAGISDFDRTLNDRGKSDAQLMGKRLAKRSVKPQLYVSSPAKRAHKTAKLVAAETGYDEKKISLEFDIYEAALEDLMHIIRGLNDKLDTVMLFGHNPAFTGLVGYLTNQFIEHLPTSGMVAITFPIESWKQVASTKGETQWIDFPKNAANH